MIMRVRVEDHRLGNLAGDSPGMLDRRAHGRGLEAFVREPKARDLLSSRSRFHTTTQYYQLRDCEYGRVEVRAIQTTRSHLWRMTSRSSSITLALEQRKKRCAAKWMRGGLFEKTFHLP